MHVTEMSVMHVELTAHGYLQLPAELARRYFPGDVLVALVRGPELWLLPMRGPAAGGLLLKQRNRAGDRSVLLADLLPAQARPGPCQACWEEHKRRIARGDRAGLIATGAKSPGRSGIGDVYRSLHPSCACTQWRDVHGRTENRAAACQLQTALGSRQLSTPDPDQPLAIPDDAIGVTTLIGREAGQWVVYLEVAFADGVRRHRIQAYPSERKAQIAAEFIRRGALRDRPFASEE